ncbi:hypothetical protein MIR68_002780 [Amoeboaphelidium protococcarum]|nr:hypothetical protein MIR68_002780 [Amoeboaphelidium protococcarum]
MRREQKMLTRLHFIRAVSTRRLLFSINNTRKMADEPHGTKDGKLKPLWASKNGEFQRQQSVFRNFIKNEPGAKFQPEAGRYICYIAYACPWCTRVETVRQLKGLQDVIDIVVVDPLMKSDGWRFTREDGSGDDQATAPGVTADPILNAKFIKELYYHADPNYNARFTVPLLWDKKLDTIVSNESSEIIRMLNSEFNHLAKNPSLDLYPEELRSKIDEVNEWVYDQFNNGVYKAGFATKQDVYEKHCKTVFEALDRLDGILKDNRYLCGSKLTEADVRAVQTAWRFQSVYHGHFKCNLKPIEAYENVLRWMRDIYQTGSASKSVNMEHIKKHYYMSHTSINPNQIYGLNDGPDLTIKPDLSRFLSK